VGYLLQRIEAFPGVVILTTNRKEAIDDAFRRRLRFVIEFPGPR
jgi:SpoVK/Ycf46/Vps4 family AAA+-type ATPase